MVNVLSAAVLLLLFWGQIAALSEQIRAMFIGATSLFALNLFLLAAWFATVLFVSFFSIGMSFVVLLASAETLKDELTRILGRDRAVLRSQSTPQRVAIALRDRFIGDTGRVISLRAFGLAMLTTLPPLILGVFFGAEFFEAGVPNFGIVEQSFQSSGGDSDTWDPLVVPPGFQDVPLADTPPVDDVAPMILDAPVLLIPETDN